MASRRKLNFGQMVREFNNLQLSGSAEIREKCDSIVRTILALINSVGGGSTDPLPPPESIGAQGFLASVRVVWASVAGATSYRLYRSTSGSGPFTPVITTSLAGHLDLGLEADTQYFYYATALTTNLIESEPSEITEATTLPDDTVGAPDVIDDFAVEDEQAFSVAFSWGELTGTAVAAEIDRRRPDAAVPTWVTIATGLTALAYVDDRVSPGVTYEYRIRALNVEGVPSFWSVTIEATTLTYDVDPPSVPQGLALTPGAGNIVAAASPSPEPDTRGYIFGIGTAPGGPYTSFPERRLSNTVFAQLAYSTPYYVVIKAIDTSENESAWSAEVSTTTLAAPVGDTTPPPAVTGTTAFSLEEGEISLQWSEVYSSDLDGYDIEVSLPPAGNPAGPYVFVRDVPAGNFRTVFTGLTPGETYSYRVRSRDTTGNLAAPGPVASAKPDGIAGPPGTSVDSFEATNLGEFVEAPGPSLPGDEGDMNDPVDGITASGTTGSTVHGYYYNTAEVNKALFLDTMRAPRAARPTTTPVEAQSWQHTNAPSVSNTNFRGRYNWAYNTGKSGAYPVTARPDNRAWVMDNNAFIDFPFATPQTLTKWAVQSYDQPASITRSCDFGSPLVGPYGWYDPELTPPPFQPDELLETYCGRFEHDMYHHTGNSCIWQKNTSNYIGGHTFYVANRCYAYEQYKADCVIPTAPALALVDNCHLIDSNINFAKGSSKIELFDYGNPAFPSYAVIRNSTLVDAYPFWRVNVGGNGVHRSLSRGKQAGWHRSMGLIGVSGYQWCENPQVPFATNADGTPNPYASDGSPGGFGADPAPMALLLVKNCLLHQQDPGKAMCQFGSVKDVIFEDCTIIIDNDPTVGSGLSYMLVNEQGYRADGNTGVRGLPRTETITFRNCLTRGVSISFRRLGTADVTLPIPEDLRNKKVTFNCANGTMGTITAYNPATDYYDLAGLINTLDPLDGIVGVPGDFDWGIPGVTV